MSDRFVISKDFVLTKMIESIFIDVNYEGYDLQIVVEYEMKKGRITKFSVWTTAPNYGIRFFAFGIDNRNNVQKIRTIDEMISLVYGNFVNDNIGFDDIIELVENAY